jgi:hypothetical protein
MTKQRVGGATIEYGGENIQPDMAVGYSSNYKPSRVHQNYRRNNVRTLKQVRPNKQLFTPTSVNSIAQMNFARKLKLPNPNTLKNYYYNSNKKQSHPLQHFLARNTGTRKLFRR